MEGFQKILLIKSMYPQGLTAKYMELIKDLVLPIKPTFFNSTDDLDGNWVAGFTTALGRFTLGENSTKVRPSYRVDLPSLDAE
jgi:hypothetical protein